MLSILIGLLLGLSAVLLTVGEGLAIAYPAYVVCGAIFITYGVRDLKIYRTFPPEEGEDESAEAGTAFSQSVEERGFASNLPTMGESAKDRRRSSGSTAVSPEGFLSGFADEKKQAKR
jgi:hypothetical protein